MTAWTTLTLKVVTPLFSGDDPATGRDPIRVPSIRGALRFWFRAVAAGHGVTDLAELWKQEEEVFGSTTKPSPIALRVSDQPDVSDDDRPEWAAYPDRRDNRFHGAQYLLGQGLWNHKNGIVRPFVDSDSDSDQTFKLKIRFVGGHGKNVDADRINSRFMLALWAWLTYGGLGARVRRGFGQLRCVGHSGAALPGRWQFAPLGSPVRTETWELYRRNPIPAGLSNLGSHGWSGKLGSALPKFPALGSPAWSGRFLAVDPVCDMGAAFRAAGQEWRAFRAVAEPEDDIVPSLHSPEWMGAIHGESKKYPIAAFGLPVNYFSTSRGNFRTTVEPIVGKDKVRRASPVWIRPIQLLDGSWQVFTFVFRSRLLPRNARLSRGLDVPNDATVTQAWNAWQDDLFRLPEDYYDRG